MAGIWFSPENTIFGTLQSPTIPKGDQSFYDGFYLGMTIYLDPSTADKTVPILEARSGAADGTYFYRTRVYVL